MASIADVKKTSELKHHVDFHLSENTKYYLHPQKFYITLMISSLLGLVLGAVVEQIIIRLQGTDESKSKAVLFIFLQLTIITFVLFVALRMQKFFGSWLQSTLAGLMFSLTFFTVQQQLSKNSSIIIG
jgi:hypothetical protein